MSIPRQQDDPNLDNLGPLSPRCPHCGRTDTHPEAVKLVRQVMADRDRVAAESDRMQLSILAEPDDDWPPADSGLIRHHTFFGAPIRLTVEWLDGVPAGFSDAAAVRDWARAQLTKLREDRP